MFLSYFFFIIAFSFLVSVFDFFYLFICFSQPIAPVLRGLDGSRRQFVMAPASFYFYFYSCAICSCLYSLCHCTQTLYILGIFFLIIVSPLLFFLFTFAFLWALLCCSGPAKICRNLFQDHILSFSSSFLIPCSSCSLYQLCHCA